VCKVASFQPRKLKSSKFPRFSGTEPAHNLIYKEHKQQHVDARNIFIMSGMVANLAIILGSMQLSKYIDWEDKSVLQNIRLLYLASNVIMFACFAYMYTQIQKKQGSHPLLL
jgi:hypothetical protein